jgi:ankyrin repeat protein
LVKLKHLRRKLLLDVVMLCAAAEAGDHAKVDRLLSSSQVSPNACGLRHKNALHLASAKGHTNVVHRLLVSKVSPIVFLAYS